MTDEEFWGRPFRQIPPSDRSPGMTEIKRDGRTFQINSVDPVHVAELRRFAEERCREG